MTDGKLSSETEFDPKRGIESLNPGSGRLLFSIRDLIVLTTITAVLLAISPSLKYLVEGISATAWMIAMWMHIVAIGVLTRYWVSVRQRVLTDAGGRRAMGVTEGHSWQRRGFSTAVWLQFVFGSIMTLGSSIWCGLYFGGGGKYSLQSPLFLPLFNTVQCSAISIWFMSSAFFHIASKTIVGQVEFFDRGVCVNGTRFSNWWEVVDLAASKVYPSAVAITMLWKKRSDLPYLVVVHLPRDQIDQVLAYFQGLKARSAS